MVTAFEEVTVIQIVAYTYHFVEKSFNANVCLYLMQNYVSAISKIKVFMIK